MAFRDDLEAARARSDALERRVAELEAENRRLREGEPEPEAGPEVRIHRGLGGKAVWVLLVVAILAATAVYAVFADLPIVAAMLGLLALAFCVQLVVLGQLLYVAPPDVALVFSGRQSGYRIVIGGRSMRMPIIEQVDALDLRVRPLEVSITGAYARDHSPTDLKLSGGVHVARSEPQIVEAAERFLGRPFDEVARVARETLEGATRAVVAGLHLEEMRLDRENFARAIIAEAEPSFDKLGLVIDSLEVVEIA